ncbi:hypothetical protein Dda_7437 [Drechslerella dactyloides]|uniref:Uncharacterized protein n=1 Tax=Drechslerella dactyloides TaxID=74499 RepID=A0AAD6NGQ2_DREDA|nr:hypothetical protein Dda_7437 [Drechslerella dactyloides]
MAPTVSLLGVLLFREDTRRQWIRRARSCQAVEELSFNVCTACEKIEISNILRGRNRDSEKMSSDEVPDERRSTISKGRGEAQKEE